MLVPVVFFSLFNGVVPDPFNSAYKVTEKVPINEDPHCLKHEDGCYLTGGGDNLDVHGMIVEEYTLRARPLLTYREVCTT